jgi:hypothetical protein
MDKCRSGYDVPGISLQGVAMHLAQRWCHCWERFWNSYCGTAFSAVVTFSFDVFSILKSMSPQSRLYFGNSRKSFGGKSRKESRCSISVIDFWARNYQKAPCELEHCHGAEYIHWAKVQAFFYAQLHVTASVFPHNKPD